MNYIRNMAKKAYDKMIEDEYIEPMAQEEIDLILQKHKEKEQRMRQVKAEKNGSLPEEE